MLFSIPDKVECSNPLNQEATACIWCALPLGNWCAEHVSRSGGQLSLHFSDLKGPPVTTMQPPKRPFAKNWIQLILTTCWTLSSISSSAPSVLSQLLAHAKCPISAWPPDPSQAGHKARCRCLWANVWYIACILWYKAMEQSHKPTDRLWYSILQFLLTVQQLWLKNLKNDLSVLKSSCQSI